MEVAKKEAMKDKKQVLKPVLRIEHKDDPIASYHLIRIILLALELAETEDKDEIERIQKNFLDIN